MVSRFALCLVLVLVTGCIAAPGRNPGQNRQWPSLQHALHQLGYRPPAQNQVSNIVAFFNAASQLDSLDYDQILALLEEYFKGR